MGELLQKRKNNQVTFNVQITSVNHNYVTYVAKPSTKSEVSRRFALNRKEIANQNREIHDISKREFTKPC